LQFLRRSGCAERFAGEYSVSLVTNSCVSKICANVASNRAADGRGTNRRNDNDYN